MELQSWSLKFALALVVAAVLWAGAASLASSLLHGRPRRPAESPRVAHAQLGNFLPTHHRPAAAR